MLVLEFDIGIIHVGKIPVKILNKTSAFAVLFLPSLSGNVFGPKRKLTKYCACAGLSQRYKG